MNKKILISVLITTAIVVSLTIYKQKEVPANAPVVTQQQPESDTAYDHEIESTKVPNLAELKDVKLTDGKYYVTLDYLSHIPCTQDKDEYTQCKDGYLFGQGDWITMNTNPKLREFEITPETSIKILYRTRSSDVPKNATAKELYEAFRSDNLYGSDFNIETNNSKLIKLVHYYQS